jgi:CheY-like chemotaxis protein
MNKQPRRVLLVDDSRFQRAAQASFLRKEGFLVITAGDGEEALRIAASERPDVIILDLLMPKLGGVHVLACLKQDPLTTDIPVIILSGLSQKNENKLTSAGAFAYFEKERFSAEMLPGLVRSALDCSPGSPAG